MSLARGRFIALEGGEASGKSTQAKLLAASLGAVLTREPGGTMLGTELRHLLLDGEVGPIHARAEALLMVADRAQHIAEVVEPALASGRDVVSDRSAMSFLAYQGYGRGLPLEELRELSEWAGAGTWPDFVVLLDVATPVAAERVAASGRALDRFETAGGDFHERVRAGFAAMAAADPERWCVMDGNAAPEIVARQVHETYQAWLAARPGRDGR